MNFKDDNLENDSFIKPTRSEKPFPDCPYLLLDLRDREDFDSCHIISGMRQSLDVTSFKWVVFLKKISFVMNVLVSRSSKFPLSHVTSNYESLHKRNPGICILIKISVIEHF